MQMAFAKKDFVPPVFAQPSINRSVSASEDEAPQDIFGFSLSVCGTYCEKVESQTSILVEGYQERSTLIETCKQMAAEAKQVWETASQASSGSAALPSDIQSFVELNQLEIEGVYEKGQWLGEISGANITLTADQLEAVYEGISAFGTRLADRSAKESLKLQSLLQSVYLSYFTLNQLQSMRTELVKMLTQGIR